MAAKSPGRSTEAFCERASPYGIALTTGSGKICPEGNAERRPEVPPAPRRRHSGFQASRRESQPPYTNPSRSIHSRKMRMLRRLARKNTSATLPATGTAVITESNATLATMRAIRWPGAPSRCAS